MHHTLIRKQLHTRETVTASMFAALILLATSVLKIQTPSFGYIHPGDAFVLLAGLFLGPLTGGLAAGIGSALSDLLGGYAIWVPGTFLVKFLTAASAAQLLRMLQKLHTAKKDLPEKKEAGTRGFPESASVIAACVIGELVMMAGYFVCDIAVVAISNGSFTRAGFAAAAALAVAGLPFNAVQGAAGIVLAAPLYSVFRRIIILH